MYRFLFKHKIGICPFPIEENDSDEIYSKMKNLLKEANDRITQQKNDFYFKSKSPEKVKYAESDTIKKNELVKCDSAILENGKFLYLDNESESEEEKFDKPLVGDLARDNFWKLYKSDRKFKDFN